MNNKLEKIINELKLFANENIINSENITKEYFEEKYYYFLKELNSFNESKSTYDGSTTFYFNHNNDLISFTFYEKNSTNSNPEKFKSIEVNLGEETTIFTIAKCL